MLNFNIVKRLLPVLTIGLIANPTIGATPSQWADNHTTSRAQLLPQNRIGREPSPSRLRASIQLTAWKNIKLKERQYQLSTIANQISPNRQVYETVILSRVDFTNQRHYFYEIYDAQTGVMFGRSKSTPISNCQQVPVFNERDLKAFCSNH